MDSTSLRIKCKECGSVSTIPARAIGQRGLLNCPRCHALTSRWACLSETPTVAISAPSAPASG